MKKIFITGGTGYVGGRIAHALLADGLAEVNVATRQSVTDLPWLPQATPITVDYDDLDGLSDAMQGCDVVFHLAAANEIVCGSDPFAAVHSNIAQGLKVLTAAKSVGVTRFINFSTAHIYGALNGLIDETTLPAPTHPYAVSHLGFEHFVTSAHLRGEIEGINLRLSNSFGAPMTSAVDRWSLIANDICRQIATSRQIVLKTDGSQIRDFIALTDVAAICTRLAHVDGALLGNGVFNLGGNMTLSILELAQGMQASAQRVLQQHIDIQRPAAASPPATSPAPLHFSTQKLANLDLQPCQPFEEELDQLLSTCLAFFGQRPET